MCCGYCTRGQVPKEARRGQQILWSQSYRRLCVDDVGAMGKTLSPGRAIQTLLSQLSSSWNCLNRSCWLGLGGFFFSLNSFEAHFILSVSSSVCVPSFHLSQMYCSTKKDPAKECILFLFLGYGLDGHNQCERSGRLYLLHWKHGLWN